MKADKVSRTEQMVFLVIVCLILVGSGFRIWCHEDELMLEVEPVLWAAEDNNGDECQVSMGVDLASSPGSSSQSAPLGSMAEVGESRQVTKDGSSQNAKELGAPELHDKGQPSTQSHKVNINTASSEELMILPGIGPVLASRILEYRQNHGPFIDVEQLMEVKGIGARTLDRLRPLVTVKDVANKDQ